MDLFVNLRDGRTVPLTGCTAIRSIDTAGTATQFTLSAITSGSANVTVTSTAGIRPGSSVFGSGIPTGATVLSITSATVFVLSANVTATIGSLTLTIASVTDADMKLLTINSGWYRDLFSSSLSTEAAQSTVGSLINNNGGATYSGPGVTSNVVVNSTVSIPGPISNSTASVTLSESSDEVAHAALRQATWLESLWAFDCTIESDTLTLYYRKNDVVGFCNVATS